MSEKNINFNDKKIKKSDFYKNKRVNRIDEVDVNKILVSAKKTIWYKNSFKYFIGYNDNDVIRPLCITLSKMIGYARKFNGSKKMSFRVNDKQLLKNDNKRWEK